MIFNKVGAAILSLFAFGISGGGRNPRVKRSSIKRSSPFAELDGYMTPRLAGGNMPAPGSKGHFKVNQRQERKASAKKRIIAAHRKAAKKAKDRRRRTL